MNSSTTPTNTTTMSSKPTTPQAAQAKVWRAVRLALLKSAKKIMADFSAEQKRLRKIAAAADQTLFKFTRLGGQRMDRECGKITRRIGILNGRLGL